MKNEGFKRGARMNDEGLKRPRRHVPVAEDYDGDDFEVDYFDSEQEERQKGDRTNGMRRADRTGRPTGI